MPDPVFAVIGGLFPWGLAGVGVAALIAVALLRRGTSDAAVAAMTGGEDLLAQADEAAIALAIRKSQEAAASLQTRHSDAASATPEDESRTEAAQTAEAQAPAEEAGIDWEECEDVYRPATADAADLAHALCPERTPEIEPEQSVILIRQSAYAQLRAHLRQDVTVELGGLLCGEAFHDPERSLYLIVVQAALPATEGIETATSFAYTPASWQALMPRLQQLDPNWTLVGSYHSHPGLGVFLSETDLDTQETIFAQDWQIALVVDPVADELGFFIGKEGEPCSQWRILPDPAAQQT
jgi:proteasome lid subunit RPN8/RPN11